MSKNIVP